MVVGGTGDIVTVELAGRLDLETSERLDRSIKQALVGRPRRVVVDLRRVTHLDSTGIRALILGQRTAGGRLVEMCLVLGSSYVRRILATTGVADRFRLLGEPAGGAFL